MRSRTSLPPSPTRPAIWQRRHWSRGFLPLGNPPTEAPPGKHGTDTYRNNETDAEFVDNVFSRAGIASKWSEDRLDKKVVAAVKDGGGPEAVRTQGKPCHDEGVGDNHEREAGQANPGRCAFVV